MEQWIDAFFAMLVLPKVGLPAISVVSSISATLLPLGLEPAVSTYIKLNPEMFWSAIIIATLGNTLGSVVDWWMGYAAKLALVRYHLGRRRRQYNVEHAHHVPHPKRHREPPPDEKYSRWMCRIGPVPLLVSWLPGIDDPLCTLAGWLRLKFRPSVVYMAIGKSPCYLAVTATLMTLPDGFWHGILDWIKSVMM